MSFPSFLEHLRMFFSGVPGAQEAPQMSKIDIEVENDELPVPGSCERSYGSLWFYVLIHIPIISRSSTLGTWSYELSLWQFMKHDGIAKENWELH